MRSWFERLTAALVRRGFREGLLGGSGLWLAVGAVAWLARFLARRPERSVVVEEIALGESITVTSVPPPPSGRRRRKLDQRRGEPHATRQSRCAGSGSTAVTVPAARRRRCFEQEAGGTPPRVTEVPAGARVRPFTEGERILLVDRKGRRYLVRLRSGRSFQSHAGVVPHDSLIGAPEGSEVEASLGSGNGRRSSARYLALRPTLADVVVGMPRGAQVIYPKDLGAIVIAADIFPGRPRPRGRRRLGLAVDGAPPRGRRGRRLRAAGGLRRAGDGERRRLPRRGRQRTTTACSSTTSTRGSTRRRSTGSCSTSPSRGGWWHTPRTPLSPGGILCAYLPSINQTADLRHRLHRSAFGLAETFEVLRRTWHIEGRSVRPDQRMVATPASSRRRGSSSSAQLAPSPPRDRRACLGAGSRRARGHRDATG